MSDVVDAATRSRMMAGIPGTDTKLELLIRKGIHARGYRFRLYDKNLPGRPDLVFPRYNAVIFIHGCFWHAHECYLFKWPASRTAFWRQKLTANRQRDEETREALLSLGWRVMTIWECAVRKPGANRNHELDNVLSRVERWLDSSRKIVDLHG